MTPTEHAQLLREVAKYLEVADIERGTVPAKSARLATRARQAAEEIEGRKVPTVDEIGRLIAASASHRSAARAIIARFGGGEAISDVKVFQVYDDAYAAETHLAENYCNNEGIRWDEDAVDARANRAGLRAVLARFGGGDVEEREVASGAAMTCSLLAQYQSEVDVIESVAGFTDESTPVGEAWARICGVLARFGCGEVK